MSVQKVALITAGSAGLGAQIARVLAPDFRVVINFANNAERAQNVLQELASIPSLHKSPTEPRFHAVQADVGVKSSVQSLVEETVEKMGRLDVLVSNAGWTRITNFLNFSEGTVEEDWDKTKRHPDPVRCEKPLSNIYNVKSHLWLMEAALPHLEQSEGAFISTASVAGVKPSGSSLPYAVTKAAQLHLTKSLAVICSPKVRVNSVSPGLLMTEWGQKFPKEKIEKSINNSKLRRLATVEDVAQNVRTLALSQSQTGQNIIIDSGVSL